MIIRALTITLFLTLAAAIASAETINRVRYEDLTTNDGVDTVFVLNKNWVFRIGDNPEWAAPEFDDGDWDSTNAALIGWGERSSFNIMGKTGWFRLHLTIDSMYQDFPLALFLQQIGASELYVDGKKLATYGKFDQENEMQIEVSPTLIDPIAFEFAHGDHHVIAVRHAARGMSGLLRNDKAYGFQLTIAKARSATKQSFQAVQYLKSLQMFFTSVSLAIAMIHFLLFVFYPSSKENLYFSVLAIGFAGLAYCPFQMTFVSTETTFSALFIAFKISLIIVSIAGLRMLLAFFFFKIPRPFWILGACGAIMNLMSWYFPLNYYYVAALISMVIGLFIIGHALFRKKRGATLIGTGYFIFAIGSTIQVLSEMQFIPRLWTIHQPYMFGILGMLITMSIQLARDFARKSNTLRNKLIEIKELSQKTIEQELKSQEQEMKQKLLETELQHQKAQLKKAEELSKAHHQLELAHFQLKTTQTQLIQSEKMASLGNLVAGVAHEINTPIGAVGSMHDTLRRAVDRIHATIESGCAKQDCPSCSEINKYITVIDDANKVISSGVSRVSEIVRKLRSFARLDEAELKTVDIHDGIEDTLSLIHHETKHGIKVEKNYGKIDPIPCFPGQLNQVFLNLLVNACQAMGGKGEITIITKQNDGRVFITIIDRGPGIPEERLTRIFDPGYTTKGVGVGTGLGLSICYRIIQSHRGEIKVTSKVGEGTTFTIILPTTLDKLLEQEKNKNKPAGDK
ncbi:MAG: ATP-binding protein [Candidatus Zixiibacteriota bacterium]